jgi:hypothetical protein
MDSLAIAAIITSIGGILIAAYTHVKHSSCCGFQLDTYTPSELQVQPNIVISTPQNTPYHTPELKHKIETQV